MAVAFSVLLCLLYSLVIWYRDYFSKSKTIATLLMLPQKRFNIYIAKLITVTSMIFGVISVQFLFWFIDLVIIKAILNVNVDGFTNVFETILANQNRFSNLIFIHPKVTNDIFLFIILPPINQSFYLIMFLKLKLILQI